MPRHVLLLAVSLLASTPVSGATVLRDSFENENNRGEGINRYSGFANFDVIGTVDLVPDSAISCSGSQGNCVDLAGDGAGGLRTKRFFDFGVGDIVTLAFDLSGNQRDSDRFFTAGFDFAGTTVFDQFTRAGAYGSNAIGGATTGTTAFQTSSIGGAAPFGTYILSFKALSAGSVKALISTSSPDPFGPILDNVSLSITTASAAVPEPATWAMMIMGFGAIGGALRRRKSPISQRTHAG